MAKAALLHVIDIYLAIRFYLIERLCLYTVNACFTASLRIKSYVTLVQAVLKDKGTNAPSGFRICHELTGCDL